MIFLPYSIVLVLLLLALPQKICKLTDLAMSTVSERTNHALLPSRYLAAVNTLMLNLNTYDAGRTFWHNLQWVVLRHEFFH
jgi:hypothetical protein